MRSAEPLRLLPTRLTFVAAARGFAPFGALALLVGLAYFWFFFQEQKFLFHIALLIYRISGSSRCDFGQDNDRILYTLVLMFEGIAIVNLFR